MMKSLVSVIVPIYRGKKYIAPIVKMIQENVHAASDYCNAELIFVNDFPEEAISEKDVPEGIEIKVRILTNPANRGIHYSRVYGLSEAVGDYILFLDQDDKISNNYLCSQYRRLHKRTDVIVANGVAQYKDYEKILYKYYFMQWTIKHIWFYAKFDCRIISPGQCLIKKECIPDIWQKEILINNGSDDYFLWLLLLTNKKKFQINRERLYTHVYTTVNASNDSKKMNYSVNEVLQKGQSYLNKRIVKIISKRISCNKKYFFVSIIEKMNRT